MSFWTAFRKIAVLRRTNFFQRSTLDMLYKTTVYSVIDYGLIVYYSDLKQTAMNKLGEVQYNAAKLASSNLHYQARAERRLFKN